MRNLILVTILIISLSSCKRMVEPNKRSLVELTLLDGSKDTIYIEYKNAIGLYDHTIVDWRNHTFVTEVKYFQILKTVDI